jgi:RNA polymerase sigma-70 factor (ECF subfamily)
MQQDLAKRWVEEFGDLLYKYTLPRVSDSGIAKDLVQETFLAAWRNIDNFKGEASEKNWLFTILKIKLLTITEKHRPN